MVRRKDAMQKAILTEKDITGNEVKTVENKTDTQDNIVMRNPDILTSKPSPQTVEQPKMIRDINALSDEETQMIIESRLRKIFKLDDLRTPPRQIIPVLITYQQAEKRPPINALVDIDINLYRLGKEYYFNNAPNATADGFIRLIQKLVQGSVRHFRVVATDNLV